MSVCVVLFENLRPGRHFQHNIGAFGSGSVAAHSMDAGFGLEMLLVAIVYQRVQPVHRLHPHVTAAAAIAAVRPAEFDELLAAE